MCKFGRGREQKSWEFLIPNHPRAQAHCPKMGPYLGTRVPIGTFFGMVPIGSLFIFQGPYFQCFGIIHAKNVNLVCMYTTMSYLDLSVMSDDLH